MASHHALVLFAHGARNAQWAVPFERIRDHIASQHQSALIKLAFLEIMHPTLDETADELVAKGIQHITLVPLFMAQGGHLKEDLPKLIASIENRHPHLRCEVTPAIGEVDDILFMIADWAANMFIQRRSH